MERITRKQLDNAVERLNIATGNPTIPYASVCDGKGNRLYVAQVGNYHIDSAYGGYMLAKMATDGGGIVTIGRRGTKREVYEQIHATLEILYREGLEK